MGGRDQVAMICENTALVGDAHLIDEVSKAKINDMSWCTCCCCLMLFLAIFAGLVTCTALYFVEKYDN